MDTSDDIFGPLNLGNPEEVSIKQLAEFIIKLTGSASKIVYLKEAQDDPRQRCPDISLARSSLNWSPRISLEEGLVKTIEHFKKLL